MKVCRQYLTDVSDRQWEILAKLLPPAKRRGCRPIDRRRVLDAIFYVLRSGCQWRLLPHDFPAWSTVYGVFRQWRQSGLWQRMNEALVTQARQAAGKKPTPTAAILDSQSVDRGKDLCLARPLSQKQQRLRAVARNQRIDDLRQHGVSHVAKVNETQKVIFKADS
jgi:transposase